MLCCSCGAYFSTAASPEKDQGSMNLLSKTALLDRTRPSSVAPTMNARVPHMLLNIDDFLPALNFIPVPIELFGGSPELDQEIAREVFRL